MDRGAWQATVHGVARVGRNLATKERERENGNSPGDLPAPGITQKPLNTKINSEWIKHLKLLKGKQEKSFMTLILAMIS